MQRYLALLLYPIQLRFYRLWALRPCNSKQKIYNKLPYIITRRTRTNLPEGEPLFTYLHDAPHSPGSWSQRIGVDWARSPGLPTSRARERGDAEARASISSEITHD